VVVAGLVIGPFILIYYAGRGVVGWRPK